MKDGVPWDISEAKVGKSKEDSFKLRCVYFPDANTDAILIDTPPTPVYWIHIWGQENLR